MKDRSGQKGECLCREKVLDIHQLNFLHLSDDCDVSILL